MISVAGFVDLTAGQDNVFVAAVGAASLVSVVIMDIASNILASICLARV